MGDRVYVCGKNLRDNTVIIGSDRDLYSKSLICRDINLIALDKIDGFLKVSAKTRYKQKEQPAVITQIDENRIRVDFEKPQRAITSGQAVVFYDGEVVIGGGTID